jgi:hypothetical protein
MVKAKPTKPALGLRVAFHSVGISCLAGSVFLQCLVFFKICSQGVFMGIEKDRLILNSEVGVTIFCAIYLLYVAFSVIRSLLYPRK